jgi:hypothetical protein
MKKLAVMLLGVSLAIQPFQHVGASTNQDLTKVYKELYASELALNNDVYKNLNKKVSEISSASIDLKNALGDWKVINVAGKGNINEGFEAIALEDPANKQVIIAYKGTEGKDGVDPLPRDWSDNYKSYEDPTTHLVVHPQDAEDKAFTKQVIDDVTKDNPNVSISLTGHGMGGHLAQSAKLNLALSYPVVTFNSMGAVATAYKDKYMDAMKNTTNYIITGEDVDGKNKMYGMVNVGNNVYIDVASPKSAEDKSLISTFYQTLSTYKVYANGKFVKSFGKFNDAKKYALSNVKTDIQLVQPDFSYKSIWKNTNQYAVYYHQLILNTFGDLSSSKAFANGQAGRRVVDLKTGKNVYFKTSVAYRYGVYVGKDKLDVFTSTTDAIAFAKKNKNSVVKDEKTGKVIYPTKK